ncbi:WD repeat-containing protein 82 [Gracilariopsis chorda]|uniref:WD repeat-containing protein 82 n=1 Tax=Gracilariopsis chorda TaxID=448386 RepID=A0A2V3IGW3_9FLOR|nr:WD repeat-containing protein 82 [Gracilariopsis chorda]|eukprot:PXF41292.1 WD repeat-containing protein 82 [Gracilariopsis chorda]
MESGREELTNQIVKSFQVARVHRQHQRPVACLDTTQDGSITVSSSSDNNIVVYDTLEGTVTGKVPVRKYGAGVIRFVQDSNPPTVVTASTAEDNKIRALDIESHSYVRYFDGHDSQVVSIAASPAGPDFISCCEDSYVMLWDCRSENPLGRVKTDGTPVVAYDPKGLIFGVAYRAANAKTLVKLYDARNYKDGPFLEFPLSNPSHSLPTCLKFSSDGEFFLLVDADSDAKVSVYDAYKGATYRTLSGHSNARGIPLEASFSPNSAFISSGSDDGSVYVWDLQADTLLLNVPSIHAMATTCTIWNPVYALLVTACQNVAFWLPSEDTKDNSY